MKCIPNSNHTQYTYTWIKKNDVLTSRAQGINSSRLTIVNLRPKDSGDYQCVVSNRTGKISSNFSTVHITGEMVILYVLLITFPLQCLHQQL